MRVDWPAVVAYIDRKDAALTPSFRGVSDDVVDSVVSQYAVVLPAVYRDFLRTMGEDSRTLRPLGDTQSHRFSALQEELPEDEYLPHGFFRVSFETDPLALASIDRFLDLRRGDADDAPLVEIEDGAPVTSVIRRGPFTFGEKVVGGVFGSLDVYGRRYRAMLFVPSDETDDVLDLTNVTVAWLTREGFEVVMPRLRRLACMDRESLSVLVRANEGTRIVAIQLGSDDRSALEKLSDELVQGVHGAEVVDAPYEQLDESEADEL